MIIVKENGEGRRDQEMDEPWTVVEESGGVEEGLVRNCCDQIFAPCLYFLLYSVWMRLPGEHLNKKKCSEGGGRMDTGRERRGGEVDKKRQEWNLSGVARRILSEHPDQQIKNKTKQIKNNNNNNNPER